MGFIDKKNDTDGQNDVEKKDTCLGDFDDTFPQNDEKKFFAKLLQKMR